MRRAYVPPLHRLNATNDSFGSEEWRDVSDVSDPLIAKKKFGTMRRKHAPLVANALRGMRMGDYAMTSAAVGASLPSNDVMNKALESHMLGGYAYSMLHSIALNVGSPMMYAYIRQFPDGFMLEDHMVGVWMAWIPLGGILGEILVALLLRVLNDKKGVIGIMAILMLVMSGAAFLCFSALVSGEWALLVGRFLIGMVSSEIPLLYLIDFQAREAENEEGQNDTRNRAYHLANLSTEFASMATFFLVALAISLETRISWGDVGFGASSTSGVPTRDVTATDAALSGIWFTGVNIPYFMLCIGSFLTCLYMIWSGWIRDLIFVRQDVGASSIVSTPKDDAGDNASPRRVIFSYGSIGLVLFITNALLSFRIGLFYTIDEMFLGYGVLSITLMIGCVELASWVISIWDMRLAALLQGDDSGKYEQLVTAFALAVCMVMPITATMYDPQWNNQLFGGPAVVHSEHEVEVVTWENVTWENVTWENSSGVADGVVDDSFSMDYDDGMQGNATLQDATSVTLTMEERKRNCSIILMIGTILLTVVCRTAISNQYVKLSKSLNVLQKGVGVTIFIGVTIEFGLSLGFIISTYSYGPFPASNVVWITIFLASYVVFAAVYVVRTEQIDVAIARRISATVTRKDSNS